jgi:hypothetical protein
MSPLSPARRVRRMFMRFSLLISVVAFFVVGSTVLLDQWLEGQASARFMFGTALVIMGACIGVFAIIAGIGLAISTVFSGERPL